MIKLSASGLMILILFEFSAGQTINIWQKVQKMASDNIVNIEYYEEMESTGSITNGNKIKRTVNGLFVDEAGLIMTSSSIYKAQLGFSGIPHFGTAATPADITVRLSSGEKLKAEFVGKDDDKNVAFIRLTHPDGQKGISFKTADDKSAGQQIFIVYQLEEEHNYQFMILEKKINSIIPGPPQKLISEGSFPMDFGLVCDDKGDPIGIVEDNKAADNFSFDFRQTGNHYIEILLASSFLDLIKNPPKYEKKNTSRKKWLGVNMQPFTRELAAYYGNDAINGIFINTVLKDSPAEKAAVQIGDVFTEFNDNKLHAENNTDMQLFRNLVREFDGDTAELKIWREGHILNKKIALAELPISQYLADEISNELLGFTAKELTKDIILAKQLPFDISGVWISRVERAGWADIAGLNVGDLLLKIDNVDLQNLTQLDDYLKKIEKTKPKYINFFVKRRSETSFLFIKTNFN